MGIQTSENQTSRSRAVVSLVRSCLLSLSLAATSAVADTEVSEQRGEYLTTILGCGGCHTDGALLGNPTGPWLAGSTLGIAYQEDETGEVTSIVYPPNLTPDDKTGIGGQTVAQLARAIKTGVKHTGNPMISVMPWRNYALLAWEDAEAIATFLLAMPPVEYNVPDSVRAGQPITHPYVRFGVYFFEPNVE